MNRYTADEAAERAGLGPEQAKRLWRALGFPESVDEAAYVDADVEMMRGLSGAMTSSGIDFDTAVNLTRGVGQTMSRLADWEVAGIIHHVAEGIGDTGVRDDATQGPTRQTLAESGRLIEKLSGEIEGLLVYVWRRHIDAAIARLAAASEEVPLTTSQLTVGFADIVQFTALSNTLTEQKIGDLVEIFESRCADVVATQQGRIIKSLGDSVLFVNDDPQRAYDTAAGIIQVIGRDRRMPDVRVGLASGTVVTRLGDVFGPPVNLAARLTAVARRNHVITDARTAAELPNDRFEVRRLPARPLRGFGVLEPVSVRRR